MQDSDLPYAAMPDQPDRETRDDVRRRISRKLKSAMTLPDEIKVSFWGDTPLVSPRMAALLRDPETRDLVLRAARSEPRERRG